VKGSHQEDTQGLETVCQLKDTRLDLRRSILTSILLKKERNN
jgi:hypothetical protein